MRQLVQAGSSLKSLPSHDHPRGGGHKWEFVDHVTRACGACYAHSATRSFLQRPPTSSSVKTIYPDDTTEHAPDQASPDSPGDHTQRLDKSGYGILQVRCQHVRPQSHWTTCADGLTSLCTGFSSSGECTPLMISTWSRNTARLCSSPKIWRLRTILRSASASRLPISRTQPQHHHSTPQDSEASEP